VLEEVHRYYGFECRSPKRQLFDPSPDRKRKASGPCQVLPIEVQIDGYDLRPEKGRQAAICRSNLQDREWLDSRQTPEQTHDREIPDCVGAVPIIVPKEVPTQETCQKPTRSLRFSPPKPTFDP